MKQPRLKDLKGNPITTDTRSNLTIRLNSDERARLIQFADLHGLTLGQAIRKLIKDAAT